MSFEDPPEWDFMDLNKDIPPKRGLLSLTPEAHILAHNEINYLFGPEGIGKSFVAFELAAWACQRQEVELVVIWHEDSEPNLHRRLNMLGGARRLQGAKIASRSASVFFDAELDLRSDLESVYEEELMVFRHYAKDKETLVIIDTASEAGMDSSGESPRKWYTRVVDPMIAAGATVLITDHPPQDNLERVSGSRQKTAKIGGVNYRLEGNINSYDTLTLTVKKDRHRVANGLEAIYAHVRKFGDRIQFEFVPTIPLADAIKLHRQAEQADLDKAIEYIAISGEVTAGELRTFIGGGNNPKTTGLIQAIEADDRVQMTKDGNKKIFRSVS